MSEIKLTKSQLKKIKKDMDKKVEMLTDAEINAIAQKVNKVINLPFLDEEKEFIVFGKIIKLVDRKLYHLLPNEYYELVKDSSDGISKEEAAKIEERLTPLINSVVNLPVITEKQEEKLIGLVLSLIINAMVKGLKLEEVDPD
jgi:uncharacterized Fe-S cluster-containing radical SAM superfamily protein